MVFIVNGLSVAKYQQNTDIFSVAKYHKYSIFSVAKFQHDRYFFSGQTNKAQYLFSCQYEKHNISSVGKYKHYTGIFCPPVFYLPSIRSRLSLHLDNQNSAIFVMTYGHPRWLHIDKLSQSAWKREREMFYLTTHSTHFIYGYMASDIWLRTIQIVRKETRCRHIGYSYWLTARVLLYAPSDRQDNTYHGLCYTSRGALAGTRNSSIGPSHEGSIRWPTTPWANTLPLSYVTLPKYLKDH